MADANFMHCHLSLSLGANASANANYTMPHVHTYIFVTVLFINAGVNDAVNAKYMTLLLLLESLACPLHTYLIHIHTYVPSFVRLIGTSAFNGLYERVSERVSVCRITDTTTKHRIQKQEAPKRHQSLFE